MQSTCQYCRQFAPVLKAFSQQTGLDVFPISLDGKGDAEFPDVLPATPDVMVEYFQSGLPVATPTTFLTNVNTMETWPLLQGAAETGEFRSRLDIEQDLPQDIPPGLNSDGEVVDFAAYEAWAQTSHQTRDMTRREEVNINHATVKTHEMDDGREY